MNKEKDVKSEQLVSILLGIKKELAEIKEKLEKQLEEKKDIKDVKEV